MSHKEGNDARAHRGHLSLSLPTPPPRLLSIHPPFLGLAWLGSLAGGRNHRSGAETASSATLSPPPAAPPSICPRLPISAPLLSRLPFPSSSPATNTFHLSSCSWFLHPNQPKGWWEQEEEEQQVKGRPEQQQRAVEDERLQVHKVRHGRGRRRRQDLHAHLLHLQHLPHSTPPFLLLLPVLGGVRRLFLFAPGFCWGIADKRSCILDLGRFGGKIPHLYFVGHIL
jgi:hypothetical protein